MKADIAIALNYDETSAPKVTAKGKGLVAEEILKLATENDIPIKEEPELVELLATVELGDQIPEALYVAVAEVIAFAYSLKGKVVSEN
ncbi:MAG: EscU/YscU/HrcU family type III secretion system export apparatus switch protein [Gammaproteobacteria bacterium]